MLLKSQTLNTFVKCFQFLTISIPLNDLFLAKTQYNND